MHLSTDDVPCDPNLLEENAIFSIFLFHHKIIAREKHRVLLLITLTDKKVGYMMQLQHSNYYELADDFAKIQCVPYFLFIRTPYRGNLLKWPT